MYIHTIFHLFMLPILVRSLKCYEGSQGEINGRNMSSFVESNCDDGMIHCFYSYSSDRKTQTAECQKFGTKQKTLDICKEPGECSMRGDVTACCCDQDLCNIPPPITTQQTTTINNRIENITTQKVSTMPTRLRYNRIR